MTNNFGFGALVVYIDRWLATSHNNPKLKQIIIIMMILKIVVDNIGSLLCKHTHTHKS